MGLLHSGIDSYYNNGKSEELSVVYCVGFFGLVFFSFSSLLDSCCNPACCHIFLRHVRSSSGFFFGSYRIKQNGTSCFTGVCRCQSSRDNCAAQGCLSAVQVGAMSGVSAPESKVTISAQSYIWASWSVYLLVLCGHSCAAVRLCVSRSSTEQHPGVWWC